MRAHKVISAFRSGGTLIEPPGEWTPPSQAKADRLIAAGCLRAPKVGAPADADKPDEQPEDQQEAPPPADGPADKPKSRGGKRGRR